MSFDELFFCLSSPKSLADFTVGPLFPTLRVGYAYVFWLDSQKNSNVIILTNLKLSDYTLGQYKKSPLKINLQEAQFSQHLYNYVFVFT